MSTSELVNDIRYTQIVEIEPQTGEMNANIRWHLAKRILFRFAFAYLVLYILPFPLDAISPTGFLTQKYNDLWNLIVHWVGKHILHLSYDIKFLPNGSGDTTYS